MTREEAIEVVKKNWPDSKYTSLREALEILIPELNKIEDEDEKIRKFFAELATDACGGPGQEYYEELGLNYDKVMGWLEKQKELPFVKDVMLGYPGVYFYDGERMHFGGNPAMEEKQKEPKPLSTEETELNSLAFLEQMGYTCIPPKKEHQNNSDAPKNALGGAVNSPLDKDKNLDDIAQDYVDGVKEYNPEPTWDLMQTAVCYGYHYREEKEQKPVDLSEMMVHKEPYIAPVPTPMVADEQKPKNELPDYDININDLEEFPKELLKHYNELLIDAGEIGRKVGEIVSASLKKHYILGLQAGKKESNEQKEQKPAGFYVTLNGEKYYAEEVRCNGMNVKVEQMPADDKAFEFEKAKAKYEGIVEGKQTVLGHPEEYGLQKPAEWSEEDEKMIDTIVSALGQYIDYKAVSGTDSGYTTPRYSKEIDWLKSLRPQPHWKPNEMQMKVLKLVAEKDGTCLQSLYKDLKKLM